MKKITFFLITFITLITNAQNKEKAKNLLDEVSARMSSFNNMYIKFSYILENKEVDIKQQTKGTVFTQSEKYNLSFMDNTFIYDGSNTYVIVNEDEEINIIEGSADEDILNPSKLLFFYEEGFAYELQDLKNNNGKTIQYIKLTPIDSNSESAYFIIGINTKTKIIANISEVGNNSTITTFEIEEFKANQDISKNLFIFDESKYSELGYTINK